MPKIPSSLSVSLAPRVVEIPEAPVHSVSFPYSMYDGAVILHLGDVRERLRALPARSIHSVVTSPPYWALRDYKAGEQELGSEETPEQYVAAMVEVFREVRRVLRDDGTVWLNLGDTYAKTGAGVARKYPGSIGRGLETKDTGVEFSCGVESGNLMGIPWRVALALQADGWILRQDIIWSKSDPMPESVRNRCTKAHEYIFLLAKSERYYFDQEAIKEPLKMTDEDYAKMLASKSRSKHQRGGTGLEQGKSRKQDGPNGYYEDNPDKLYVPLGANKRSVWVVSNESFSGAHFATFPQKLIEPCILAGTPERCCSICGAPQQRVVESEVIRERKPEGGKMFDAQVELGNSALRNGHQEKATRTVGWSQGCTCEAELTPGTVLDPFVGSGTTMVVALNNGRRGVGIDLSEEYLRTIAIPRIEGAGLKVPELAQHIVASRPPRRLLGGERS